MHPVVACIVCARPLDSLLTSGLQAGVLVMAVVAATVVALLVRGAVRLLREDAATAVGNEDPRNETPRMTPTGASAESGGRP